MQVGRHVCTLALPKSCVGISPTAPWWKHFGCKLREFRLVCHWHQRTKAVFPSRTRVCEEQRRQLATSYWFIFHPFSPIVFAWQCFVTFAWFFTLIAIPVLVFLRSYKLALYRLLISSNFVAVMNIAVNFMTGYEDSFNKIIVLGPEDIATNYMRTYFFFDFLSSFPHIKHTLDRHDHALVHVIIYLLQGFRFPTFYKYLHKIFFQFQISYGTVVTIRSLIDVLFFMHWTCYLYYVVPKLTLYFRGAHSLNNSWHNLNYNNNSTSYIYSVSNYYAMALALGIGYYQPGDDHLIEEILLTCVISILGLIFFSYVTLRILRLGMNTFHEAYIFNAKEKELEDYMQSMNLPRPLQNKVLQHVYHTFEGYFLRDQIITAMLNDSLKQEIALELSKKLFERSYVFRVLPVVLVRAIALSVLAEVYMPGDVIIEKNAPCTSLYHLSRGTCALYVEHGVEKRHVRGGYQFGETSLLKPDQKADATLIALEICDVLRLPASEFQRCVSPYQQLRRKLDELSKNMRDVSLSGGSQRLSTTN